MKKIILALAAAAVVMAFSSCLHLTQPVAVTTNPVGNKIGEASASFLFGSLPLKGDNSYQAAAKNGGVQYIATVEERIDSNPFITVVTTIVTGQ
jgi:hypothetical protein